MMSDYDLQAPMCEDAEAGQGVPLPGRGREAGARDPRRPGQEEEEEEVSVKLLPCPFCGGEAKFVKTSDEIVPGRVELVAWNVKCSRCFASPLPNNYEGSKEAVAERWNRRAERTCRVEVSHGFHGPGPRFEGNVWTMYHVCSECDGAIDRDDAYCKHCGAKVVGE